MSKQLINKNGDLLFPITKAIYVSTSDDDNVQNKLDNLSLLIATANQAIATINQAINDINTEISEINGLPDVTAADNGKGLIVSGGEWGVAKVSQGADWNASVGEDGYIANKPVADAALSTAGAFADAKAAGDAIALKQDELTFDQTPTANSTNPVTSGGVHAAIQTDTTLTVSGKAADAKKTGDEIEALKALFVVPDDDGVYSLMCDVDDGVKQFYWYKEPATVGRSRVGKAYVG